MVWFLVILAIFALVLQWLGFWMQETKNGFESQELQRNALMMMDSLVKNRDTEKPQFGAAVFDAEKKRVRSNALERQLLQAIPSAQEKENLPVFFKKIELRFADGKKETIFEIADGTNCLSVERFVVVGTKKALVQGTICHE